MTLSKAITTYNIPLHPLHVKSFDVVIMLGTMFLRDDNTLKNLLDTKEFIYLSPIEDDLSKKAKIFSKYEAGTEEGVLALLMDALKQNSDEKLEKFLEELDIGYLSAESNIGEEETEEMALFLQDKKTLFILGKDLEYHPKAENLAKLLGMLGFYCGIDIALLENSRPLNEPYQPLIADEIEELESFDGVVTYRCLPLTKDEESLLIGSPQFAISAKIKDGFDALIKTSNNQYNRKFKIDPKLKGTIALLPTNLEDTSYRYEVSQIIQAG